MSPGKTTLESSAHKYALSGDTENCPSGEDRYEYPDIEQIETALSERQLIATCESCNGVVELTDLHYNHRSVALWECRDCDARLVIPHSFLCSEIARIGLPEEVDDE